MEFEQMRKMLMPREYFPADHYPTVREVQSVEEELGELLVLKYSSSSHGMMMGSNASYSLTAAFGEKSVLTETDKREYSNQETVSVYELKEETEKEIRELVKRENLAMWAALKLDQSKRMVVYDYSRSASFSLEFACSAAPMGRIVRNINIEAAEQAGGGEVMDQLRELLERDANEAQLRSTETVEVTGMMGMGSGFPPLGTDKGPSMGGRQVQPPKEEKPREIPAGTFNEDGSWNCVSCGTRDLTVKFCPVCGSPRPKQ